MRHRLNELQQDFSERQKNSSATAGGVYCCLSGGMTCVDAENDARAEDTVVRADSALQMAKAAGGNYIELIPPAGEGADAAAPVAASR